MAFFLCSEPWDQTQGSCQVDWVEKLTEPCLLDIPSKAQMFQRMCAPTSEWIPRLHNHSVCKVMVSGMGTCDSGRYRWCICRKWALCLPGWMLLQHGLVQWLSTGIFAHVERNIKPIQGLFNRTRWTILHEKGLQKSQGKTHKSQVNDSLQACGWWSIQRGPDKVTATEQLCPERGFLLITGLFLHVAPTCGIIPLLEAKKLLGSQEQSLSPL